VLVQTSVGDGLGGLANRTQASIRLAFTTFSAIWSVHPPSAYGAVSALADSALTEAERRFFGELDRLGVRYLLVGVSAALLQGANTATQDLDLWFEDLSDPRIGEAARLAGGAFIPGGVALRPPLIGGDLLGDRLDVVVHMHGLRSFAEEYASAKTIPVEGISLRVLPLRRIIESKRVAGRPRDLAQIPALEEALAALDDEQS
jgi:hypothetical protein